MFVLYVVVSLGLFIPLVVADNCTLAESPSACVNGELLDCCWSKVDSLCYPCVGLQADVKTLLSIVYTTWGVGPTAFDGANPDTITCPRSVSTSGIGCDKDGFITEFKLNNQGIIGELDVFFDSFQDLIYCQRVTYLSLGINGLHGTIPASLADWTNLEELDLAFNYFRGDFPNINALTKLTRCDIVDKRISSSFWSGYDENCFDCDDGASGSDGLGDVGLPAACKPDGDHWNHCEYFRNEDKSSSGGCPAPTMPTRPPATTTACQCGISQTHTHSSTGATTGEVLVNDDSAMSLGASLLLVYICLLIVTI